MNWRFWEPKETETTSLPAPSHPREGRLDRYSSTWEFISQWLEADLAKTRESNDSTKKDALQTAELRGRIKLLKELLALPDAKLRHKQVSDDPNDY